MEWGDDPREAIALLQAKVRATGSFVHRALVREMKIASENCSRKDAGIVVIAGRISPRGLLSRFTD